MARTGAYDKHYREYEQWFRDHPHVYQSELRAVGHLLPRTGEGLEVGVGSGRFAGPLGIRIGVEPCRAMRSLAERSGIEVYEAAAEHLPFGDERFDFVLMVTTICFLDDPERAFQEVRRVLRSGGVFVVGFVDKDSPLGRSYQARKDENPFYREATFYGTEDVLSLLQRNGFEPPEIVQTIFGSLGDVEALQHFRKGHGEGGFVALRAAKGR